MKVALFSDVHGHLRIVLHLIRNWQMEHHTHLDGALIAGDLGCFPDPAKLDKATQRRLAGDPEQAGFSMFFTEPHESVERLFNAEYGDYSDVSCPIYFVPGNHEDYEFLEAEQRASHQDTFAVDCYQRFHCIRDGAIINLHGHDGHCLRIAGLWGIENTVPNAPYQIKPKVVRKLEACGINRFDLLLTHDAPALAHPTGGAEAVTRVIQFPFSRINLAAFTQTIRRPARPKTRTASPGAIRLVAFAINHSGGLPTLTLMSWIARCAGKPQTPLIPVDRNHLPRLSRLRFCDFLRPMRLLFVFIDRSARFYLANPHPEANSGLPFFPSDWVPQELTPSRRSCHARGRAGQIVNEPPRISEPSSALRSSRPLGR